MRKTARKIRRIGRQKDRESEGGGTRIRGKKGKRMIGKEKAKEKGMEKGEEKGKE